MFGGSRRQSRHQPNPPLSSSNANPNASTAAAAAFMASSQNSNKALSSAAAAAALRARPHTPTNVAEVQTKRTMRRSPSVSSTGSGVAAGRGAPRLERRGSSGSMTERTFRSPSPHGERRSDLQQQPPVPAIPAGHRVSRSTSSAGVGMQNFRTASQKLDAALPSWYTKPTGNPGNVRTSDAPMTSVTRSTQARPESIASIPQRSESRNSSINFSYPGRLRAQSPPASPSADYDPQWTHLPVATPASPPRSNRTSVTSVTRGTSTQGLVYDPNSRRMVPKIDTEAVEYRVREAAEKQPKKKKNVSGVQRSGSHLAKGTVARIKGTTVEPDGQEGVQHGIESEPSNNESRGLDQLPAAAIVTAPQPKQRQKQQQRGGMQQAQLPEDSRTQNISPAPQKAFEHGTSPRTSQLLARKPSVVREETDEDEDDTELTLIPSKEVLDALDAVPTRETLYERPKEQSAEDAQTSSLQSNPVDHEPTWTQSHAHPESVSEAPREQKRGVIENKPVLGLAQDDSTSRRSTSLSPARQARFAATTSEKLTVRHAPLPRSASPIKSALKHSSPSPRDGSPSENNPDLANSRVSSGDQDRSHPRKKSVRVSFDDRSPVVVGEATIAEDVDPSYLPSPQTKRPWYSNIARSKKKEIALDDDEVMKPRPALPSFGSVREKKIREPEEERPLIRPHEPAPASLAGRPYSPGASGEPEEAETLAVGLSSDHAVGSALAQDYASRNPANISRFREPLPPVVTSVEGYGYASDSSKSSDSDDDQFNSAGGESDKETIPSTQTTVTTIPESYDSSQNGSTVLEDKIPVPPVQSATSDKAIVSPDQDIPDIAVTLPSPAAVDERMGGKKSSPYFVDIPGGFPEDDSDESQATLKHTASTGDAVLVANAMKEPQAEVLPSQGRSLPQTTLATTAGLSIPDDNSENESNASIYSDAYEDLSEAEGDGYLSLNAVVESPIHEARGAQLPGLHAQESNKLEETNPAVQHAVMTSVGIQSNGSTQPADNWEQAKSFWRSLTADKRHQLEREAMEDAGTEGDQEDGQTPTRQLSNRAKKTAEQKQATSVAQMAKAQAAPSTSKSQPAQPIHPDRVYMIKPGTRATHGQSSPTNAITPTKTGGRMRASMRGPQSTSTKPTTVTKAAPGEGGMRKSMRSNTATASVVDERATRRLTAPAGPAVPPAPAAATRPKSATIQSRKGAPTHGRSTSFEIDAGAAAALSTHKRRGSDASDSSFKRTRAATSEGFNFPRSMRQGSAPEHKATRSSGRFSLRSMSPGGSPFRRASTSAVSGPPASNSMRRTLRSGSESSHESKRPSMRFPSFGRSSKPPAKLQEPSTRSSRFGDSSDEDQPAAGFRSRFDDSSDEDDVRPSSSSRPLAKGTLRGSGTAPTSFKNVTTPVPEEEEEDSPELPDSDDEPSMHLPSPMQSPKVAASYRPAAAQRNSSGIGTSTLKRSGSGRGSLIASPTIPAFTTKDRRSSFMSNILRRNKKANQTDKITRSELTDSAARRDTKLERNASQLRDIRSDSQPTSPKLQKRNGVARGDSWPLPEPAEDERPNTAGGRVNGEQAPRPTFGDRRYTSLGFVGTDQQDSILGVETAVSVGGGHQKKKKKFGALRRMFRLDE